MVLQRSTSRRTLIHGGYYPKVARIDPSTVLPETVRGLHTGQSGYVSNGAVGVRESDGQVVIDLSAQISRFPSFNSAWVSAHPARGEIVYDVVMSPLGIRSLRTKSQGAEVRNLLRPKGLLGTFLRSYERVGAERAGVE
jgi:hypothetical protein